MDLEEAYDRVPSGKLVLHVEVRGGRDVCEVGVGHIGVTQDSRWGSGLQRSPLSPFLPALILDRLTDEVKQESPWTMMYANDTGICNNSRD